MKTENEGYTKGELCNRNNCDGIIKEHNKEGCCSCHINPPCGYCTESAEYCDKCGWEAIEEQEALDKVNREIFSKYEDSYRKQRDKERARFYDMYSGKNVPEKFEYRREEHTHFSMRIIGVHPIGFDVKSILNEIKGTFGGRFAQRTDTTFEYIAYTD